MADESTCESEMTRLIKSKLKAGLQRTQTRYTEKDGSVSLFTDSGLTLESKLSASTSTGYVIDTKPDLSVGSVRPWLFVSSQDVPVNSEKLQEFKITHVLSLLPGFELPDEIKSQVEHVVVDFYDEESFDIINSNGFQIGMEFMSQAKESSGNVLVHCNAGLSRAPSFVICYLIKYERMGWEEAIECVKRVRNIRPNSGFIRQIKELSLSLTHS